MRLLRFSRLGLAATTMLLAALAVWSRFDPLPEGLRGSYFDVVDWSSLPVRSVLDGQPSTAAISAAWDGQPPEIFSTTWRGSLIALAEGTYTFATISDDGSWVYLDERLVVANAGPHAKQIATGSVHLNRGVHRIFIQYFQQGGDLHLTLLWGRGSRALEPVPSWALAPGAPTFRRFVLSVVVRRGVVAAGWLWVAALLLALAAAVRSAWPSLVNGLAGVADGLVRTDLPPGRLTRRDHLWAAVAAGLALAVYVRTAAPGLIGIIDTPMFQFIGRVLGTAHNPGYPLYVFLTYPFSYLPIGSLAYRINLFSALMGAGTVYFVFLIARQLGCGLVISFSAALALAFGRVFWSQSVLAEVYTLNSAIVAGMLLAMLAWERTGRPRLFVAAITIFSIGLGNHTTILGFLPGMLVYGWLTNRAFLTRAKTIAAVTVLPCVGMLQYLFIVVRSRQAGTYTESRATTISALFDVLRGKQFSDHVVLFGWRTLIGERLPFLFSQYFAREIAIPAAVLALTGVFFLFRRRVAQVFLFLPGVIALVGFVLIYDFADTDVFLIPAFLVIWICAAVGAEYLVRVVARQHARAGALLAISMLVFPAWNVSRNFAASDRSTDNRDQVFFDRLFAALPDRTFLTMENFVLDRMVKYKLLGEQSANGREILHDGYGTEGAVVRAHAANGFTVLVFEQAVRALRPQGFDFVPFLVMGDTLQDFLSRLARGTTVAIAVPAAYAPGLEAAGGASFVSIGGPIHLTGGNQAGFALLGVRGSDDGAREQSGTERVTLDVSPHQQLGRIRLTTRSPVHIGVDTQEAVIVAGSREVVRTSAGVAVAVWAPDGQFQKSLVLRSDAGFRGPTDSGVFRVHRLRGLWTRHSIRAAGWTDVKSSASTGVLLLKASPGRKVVLYLEGTAPLAPRLFERSSPRVQLDVRSYEGDSDPRYQANLEEDVADRIGLIHAARAYRIELNVPVTETAPGVVTITLGGIPARAFGRLFLSSSALWAVMTADDAATAFDVNTWGWLDTSDPTVEMLDMAVEEHAQLLGDGWSPPIRDDDGSYRWMSAPTARVLLPLTQGSGGHVRIQALYAEQGSPAASIRLAIDGSELPRQSLRPGWAEYRWALPSGMLHERTNEIVLAVEPAAGVDGPNPHVAVGSISVEHRP